MKDKKSEPEYTLKQISPVRKSIIAKVSESFRDIPQFDLHTEINAASIKSAREQYKSSSENRAPGYNDILIYCTAKALRNHPYLNAHFTQDGIKEFSEVNVAFAVATEMGVLMPVVRNADRKNVDVISSETAEMSKLAQACRLRASLQFHGTFSVSSLGSYGIDSFNAIINPPQVAILAAGAIQMKPVCINGEITAAPMIHLTLTVDHRAVDGDMAARFMAELKDLVENFEF